MARLDLKSQLLARPEVKELAIFRRQYLQRYNVKEINFPAPGLLQIYRIQQWIWSFVEAAQERLCNPAYDRLFLKALLDRIEAAVENAEEPDIVDDFAELYSSLLGPSNAYDQTEESYAWVEYVPPWHELDPSRPEDGLELLERPNILSAAASTGHRTWEAALFFTRWLEDSSMVRGKRILELGAGTGLLSLLAAKQGAASVVATDMDANAMLRLAHAARRNKLSVVCKQYIWGDDVDTLGSDFDVIVGADVIYDPTSIPDLCGTLEQMSSNNPRSVIWLSTVTRNENTQNYFRSSCGQSATHLGSLWIKKALRECKNANKIAEKAGFSLCSLHEPIRARDQTGFFFPSTVPIEVTLLTRIPASTRLVTFDTTDLYSRWLSQSVSS